MNYLDEKDTYKGIKNDLISVWIKGKFNTKGNFSYLDTNSKLQDTKFVRGGIVSERTGEKGSWTTVEVWNTTGAEESCRCLCVNLSNT